MPALTSTLVALLSNELYSETEYSGASKTPHEVAYELGYRKGWNDRARSLLRSEGTEREFPDEAEWTR